MNLHCLSKEELGELIEDVFENSNHSSMSLRLLALEFDTQLIGLSLFLVYFLLRSREEKTPDELLRIISSFNSLENEMYFSKEDSGPEFLDFLLRSEREKNLTLEEQLVSLTNRYYRFDYEKTLRL